MIAYDEIEILGLCKAFLEGKWREVITVIDGRKCVETYKSCNQNRQ